MTPTPTPAPVAVSMGQLVPEQFQFLAVGIVLVVFCLGILIVRGI